jgi:putative transposase
MPKRSIDLYQGEYYHVYNRGSNRGMIFFDRENYLFFLQRFREKVPAEHVTVLAYCLMPNHYHFLVRLESEEFSARMQAFGTSFSKAINKHADRSGGLFQGRFQAKHVEEESYLVHLSRYIHLNPVEAQLVNSACDWEFSSYREYIGTRTGTLPNTEILLRDFCSRSHYREFVETKQGENKLGLKHLLFTE